VPQALEIEIFR